MAAWSERRRRAWATAALERLAEEQSIYLHGGCVGIAAVMHRLTGWPLFGLFGFDEDVGREVLIHAYVRPDADTVVDLKGPRAYDEMLHDFWDDPAMFEAGEAPTTMGELARMVYRARRCPVGPTEERLARRVLDLTMLVRPDLRRPR